MTNRRLEKKKKLTVKKVEVKKKHLAISQDILNSRLLLFGIDLSTAVRSTKKRSLPTF